MAVDAHLRPVRIRPRHSHPFVHPNDNLKGEDDEDESAEDSAINVPKRKFIPQGTFVEPDLEHVRDVESTEG